MGGRDWPPRAGSFVSLGPLDDCTGRAGVSPAVGGHPARRPCGTDTLVCAALAGVPVPHSPKPSISKTLRRTYRPMSMIRRLTVLLLLVASTAAAQSRRPSRPGTGNPDEQIVPWKFLDKGAELVKAPIVVYWIPSSLKDIEYTPLYVSNVLLE